MKILSDSYMKGHKDCINDFKWAYKQDISFYEIIEIVDKAFDKAKKDMEDKQHGWL